MNFSFLIFCPAFFAGNCLCSYAVSSSLSVPWAELTHISHPEHTHPFFPCMKRCTLFNFPALTKRYDGYFVTENRKRTIFPLVKFLLYSDKWGEPFVAEIFTFSLSYCAQEIWNASKCFPRNALHPSVSHCFSALLSLSFYYFPIFARREILKWRKNKRERERGSLLFKLFFFNFPFAIDTQKIAWLRLQFHEKETFFLPRFFWDNSAQCSFPAKKMSAAPPKSRSVTAASYSPPPPPFLRRRRRWMTAKLSKDTTHLLPYNKGANIIMTNCEAICSAK